MIAPSGAPIKNSTIQCNSKNFIVLNKKQKIVKVSKVTEPLSQLKSIIPKITKTQGRGLGLNLVKQIVDQHHGKIAVTSNKNLGTRFVIILPLNI